MFKVTWVFKLAERMRMDLVLAALAFARMAEIDWSWSEGLDESLAYCLATGVESSELLSVWKNWSYKAGEGWW